MISLIFASFLKADLMKQLPFILGCIIPGSFDVIGLGQMVYYGKKSQAKRARKQQRISDYPVDDPLLNNTKISEVEAQAYVLSNSDVTTEIAKTKTD